MSALTKIAVVEPSGLLYGSELALLDILEGLDRSEFKTEVHLPPGAPLKPRLKAIGVSALETLPPLRPVRHKVLKLGRYLTLARRWWWDRPDLVYVNQAGILRPIAAIAALLRLPVVCQVQTVEDARWVGRVRHGTGPVRGFICNSRFTAGELRVPREKLCVLYQGYRFKGLRQLPKSRSSKEPFVAGVLGRICASKGHYLLLEALRMLKAQGERNLRCRFIGAAPTPLDQQKIEALANQSGVAELVQFRGYQTDLPVELAELDFMVIPSLSETFGRILFEAAEAERPVLLSDCGGLGELSRHFGIGERFAVGRAEALAQGLIRMMGHYDEKKAAFAPAARRMLSSLDLKEYIAVCSRILRRAASGHPVAIQWFGGPQISQ